MEQEGKSDSEALKVDVEVPVFTEAPEKLFVLYEVEFELKNKTTLLCTFSRTYIQ
jgi:hypothetical protein